MRKIKWGIVGTGNIAHSFANDFKYVQHGVLHAVASRSMKKASEFCNKYHIPNAYDSYDKLYKDEEIDIIYIATPHNFHFQNASDALRSGKAVLCEKPITVEKNECIQLIEVANSTGNYLMEAMWTYFLPPILEVQKWINEGEIGNVQYIKADFGFKANRETNYRLFNPDLAGGALLDIGIYPIALAWLVYKQIPKNVSAIYKKTDSGVDSEEIMIFEYSNGEVANLSASITYKMPNEAIIVGDEGYIRIPDFFMAKEAFLYKNDQLQFHFIDSRVSVGYNFEVEAMQLDVLQGKKESEIVPLNSSLKLQEMLKMVKCKF